MRKLVRESYLLPSPRDGKGDETFSSIENHAGDCWGTPLRNRMFLVCRTQGESNQRWEVFLARQKEVEIDPKTNRRLDPFPPPLTP